MNLRRRVAAGAAVLTTACALALVPAGTASAHPLGNFTVNRYDGLVAAPGELRVHHVEDLAEIPATQAGPDIERLGRDTWARHRCTAAARDREVRVGGRTFRVPLIERVSRIPLRTIPIEVKVENAFSRGGIPLERDLRPDLQAARGGAAGRRAVVRVHRVAAPRRARGPRRSRVHRVAF